MSVSKYDLTWQAGTFDESLGRSCNICLRFDVVSVVFAPKGNDNLLLCHIKLFTLSTSTNTATDHSLNQ